MAGVESAPCAGARAAALLKAVPKSMQTVQSAASPPRLRHTQIAFRAAIDLGRKGVTSALSTISASGPRPRMTP